MLLINFIILSFIFFNFIQAISLMPSSKKLQFERFDGMCRGKNVPIRTQYRTFNSDKSVVYFNITTTVTEDIEGVLKTLVKIMRCRSKENLDTCEDFLKPKPTDYCKTLPTNQKHVNPFFIDYNPPYTCPIKKGTYRAYNFKMDIAAVGVFPLGDSYWRVAVELRNEANRLLNCMQVEAHLVNSH